MILLRCFVVVVCFFCCCFLFFFVCFFFGGVFVLFLAVFWFLIKCRIQPFVDVSERYCLLLFSSENRVCCF